MAFRNDAVFPSTLAVDSTFSLGFRTDIICRRDGKEYRTGRWSRPQWKAEVSPGIKDQENLNELQDFYLTMAGAQNSFRVKMPAEFTTAANGRDAPALTDQVIGTFNAQVSETFQLFKTYTDSGGYKYRRIIDKPVDGTLLFGRLDLSSYSPTLLIEDTNYTVDYETGIITMLSSITKPQPVLFGCEYDIHMRFEREIDELMSITIEDFDKRDISIPLIEVPIENPLYDEYEGGGAVNHGSISNSIYITPSEGRVHAFNPQNSTLSIYIPDADLFVAGGAYLVLFNDSTSYDIAVRTEDGTQVTTSKANLATKGSATILCVYHDASGTYSWGAIKRT